MKTLSASVDATCMLMQGGAWRNAMVGTISALNSEGELLHTIYLGEAPEQGNDEFYTSFKKEWDLIKAGFPNALTQGIADGAPSNWKFLDEITDYQILDFYHLSDYIHKAAHLIFGQDPKGKKKNEKDVFLEYWHHKIKYQSYGVSRLIETLEQKLPEIKSRTASTSLRSVIKYLTNQCHRTKYARELKAKRPIGSGVTEAASKTLIKQRMCGSGMKWSHMGARNIIHIRALVLTNGRFEQFWQKILRYGIN